MVDMVPILCKLDVRQEYILHRKPVQSRASCTHAHSHTHLHLGQLRATNSPTIDVLGKKKITDRQRPTELQLYGSNTSHDSTP